MKAEMGPHLRPWEVRKLTLAEVIFYCRQVGNRTGSGAPAMSEADILAYCHWLYSMPPAERLKLAREGKLL